MVSTTDAHGMARQVEKERENLADAAIDDDDRTAIEQFTDHREMNESVAASTLRSDLSNLRRAAERAETPLLEFESVKDANALLKTNADEHDVSPASNDNYRKALRVFFGWLDNDPDYGEYEWWEDVKIPARDPKPVDPAEVLSVDEVRALRDAADHPREKALVEFLADTGMRITAALQLQRGDVDGLNGDRPTVAVNRNGEGQKGMDPLPRPIIHSEQWLTQYLNQYHPDDHPKAPAFATKYYEHRDREECAIHPTTTLNKLKDLAEAAGIDRDRVNNHAFRHVATTRMRRDMGMDWDDIAHRTGWSERSLARMKQVYAHLSNEDKNERVWAAVGSEREDVEDVDTPNPDCRKCGRSIGADERYCPGCGADQEATPEDEEAPVTREEFDALLAHVAALERGEDPRKISESVKRETAGNIQRSAAGNNTMVERLGRRLDGDG